MNKKPQMIYNRSSNEGAEGWYQGGAARRDDRNERPWLAVHPLLLGPGGRDRYRCTQTVCQTKFHLR